MATAASRRGRVLVWLTFGCLACMAAALLIGNIALDPLDTFSALVGEGSRVANAVIQEMRGPRVLLGALVGAALGIAGVVAQALVRNPLADPGLLGAEHGAGLAVLLVLALAPEWTAFAWSKPLASMAGAVLSLLLLLALAGRRGGVAPLRLVLVGIGVNLLLGAMMTLCGLLVPMQVYESLLAWFAGTLVAASLEQALWVAVALVVATPLILRLSREMDIHALGDDLPRTLGISLVSFRLQLAAYAVVLAGTAWAAAGGIPFVGLLAPHIGRRLVGTAHRTLLPATALLGAGLVVFADAVGRVVMQPAEAPAGILVALIGGPFFALLLVRPRRASA
jgi:iron complex transport system permease protein